MNQVIKVLLFIFAMSFLEVERVCAADSAPKLLDGVYQIKTADELLWFAHQVSVKGNAFINCILLNDIDVSGKEWIPIGNTPEKNSFWGVFDGGGHTVSGLQIKSSLVENWQYAGMFNSATHCTIKNLTVKGCINCNTSGASCMAGLIARAWDAKVVNVHSFIDIIVSGSFFGVGGLAGYSHDSSTFDDCSFHGVITCNTSDYYGGIVGTSGEAAIRNCANYGKFVLANNGACTGGIIGLADNANLLVTNALSIVEFDGEGKRQALIGHIQAMSFLKSRNNYFLPRIAGLSASDNTSFNATIVSVDDLASGKVTYCLNQGQADYHWYQTLGVDPYPVLDSKRAVVQQLNGKYINTNGAEFCEILLAQELAYCDTVKAQQSLIDVYRKALCYHSDTNDPMAFIDLFNSLQDLRVQIQHSAEVYRSYDSYINECRQKMTTITSSNDDMSRILVLYLNSYVEPGEKFTKGSSLYIIQNHLLGETLLKRELEWVSNMLYVIQNSKYSHRQDVTHLLINANFSNKFFGWQNVGCEYHWSPETEMVSVNGISDSLNVYQVLTGLPNGIYEFSINGYYGSHNTSAVSGVNHIAQLYANDMINYLRTKDDISEFGTENTILTKVTNGILFVGVKVPKTESTSGSICFSNSHLYYYGTLENADAALQDVIKNQVEQASSILNTEYPGMEGDYINLPNFSQSLKDALRQLMDKASSVESSQDKFDLIQNISSVFEQIRYCQDAYLGLIDQLASLKDRVENVMQSLLTEEQQQEFDNLRKEIENGYRKGLYSAEEARDYKGLKSLSFLTSVESKEPKQLNGFYQIEEPGHLLWFANAVNDGNSAIKAQLTNDINIIGILKWNPIGVAPDKNSFWGSFDGQNHTISGFLFSRELGDWGMGGLFGSVTHGTVKNLTIKGKMICQGGANSMFGAIARAWGTTLQNIHVEMEIETKGTGYYGVGGLTGYAHDNTIIQDCSFSGYIQCNSTDCYGGIAGRCTISTSMNNCANYGHIYNNMNGGYIGGVIGLMDDTKSSMSYCLNVGEMHGNTPALIGYLVAADMDMSINNYWYGSNASRPFGNNKQLDKTYLVGLPELASGEVAYEMNESQDQMHWYQTLGTDLYPLLDSSHGIVQKEWNGYINTGINSLSDQKISRRGIYYDLNGRVVKKPSGGIYISDEKKFLQLHH